MRRARCACRPRGSRSRCTGIHTVPYDTQLEQGSRLSHLILRSRQSSQLSCGVVGWPFRWPGLTGAFTSVLRLSIAPRHLDFPGQAFADVRSCMHALPGPTALLGRILRCHLCRSDWEVLWYLAYGQPYGPVESCLKRPSCELICSTGREIETSKIITKSTNRNSFIYPICGSAVGKSTQFCL